MESKEEKIKKFFSDEEKVKSIINDEEFINKIESGTATIKDYKEKFKSLGLELTSDEAQKVIDGVNAIMNTPTEKLEDISLENVSGGTVPVIVGTSVAIAGIAGALACSISSAVYRSKSNKLRSKDNLSGSDEQRAAKYESISKALGCYGVLSSIGVAVAGGITLTVGLHNSSSD